MCLPYYVYTQGYLKKNIPTRVSPLTRLVTELHVLWEYSWEISESVHENFGVLFPWSFLYTKKISKRMYHSEKY